MGMKVNGSTGLTFPDSTTMVTGNQAVKAWVNFNGTGTVAIRASYNVTSITDNGTGDYTLNFTTAFPNANYALVGTTSSGSSASGTDSRRVLVLDDASAAPTTTTARVRTINIGVGSLQDANYVMVSVFR